MKPKAQEYDRPCLMNRRTQQYGDALNRSLLNSASTPAIGTNPSGTSLSAYTARPHLPPSSMATPPPSAALRSSRSRSTISSSTTTVLISKQADRVYRGGDVLYALVEDGDLLHASVLVTAGNHVDF